MITGNGTFGVNQAQTNCSYTYSSIGDLTNKCGAVLSYGDANHPSAVTNHSTLAKNYTYDANGNMVARGNQTLAWTIDHRVASVSISGGGTTSMEYDYSGMRVKKSAPAGVTLYPFAGYEIDPSGVVTKFIRAGGESIASKKGANKYFYHNDHLGSVNVISTQAGAKCQLNEYDPWGAVSRSEGATPGSLATCDTTHRFTGQELDPETGLYYYGGRYYDQEISRFISPDPYVQEPDDPQNLNRYTYVLNSPMNYTDPSGFFFEWLVAIATAISSAIEAAGTAAVAVAAVQASSAAVASAGGEAWASSILVSAAKGCTEGCTQLVAAATKAVESASAASVSANGAVGAAVTKLNAYQAAIFQVSAGMTTTAAAGAYGLAKGGASLGPLPKSPTGDLIRQMHGGGKGGGGSNSGGGSGSGGAGGKGPVNLPFNDPKLASQIEKVVQSLDMTGSPPAGVHQGGAKGYSKGTYLNDPARGRALPAQPKGYYTESDVWPGQVGNRPQGRLVVGQGGEVYYSPQHYQDFIRLR